MSKEDVEGISPLHLLESGKVRYPPVYMVIGTEDEVFDTSHVTEFDAALKKRGIESRAAVVPGARHAFNAWANVGDEVEVKIIKPAVEWIAGFASVKK